MDERERGERVDRRQARFDKVRCERFERRVEAGEEGGDVGICELGGGR